MTRPLPAQPDAQGGLAIVDVGQPRALGRHGLDVAGLALAQSEQLDPEPFHLQRDGVRVRAEPPGAQGLVLMPRLGARQVVGRALARRRAGGRQEQTGDEDALHSVAMIR